MKRRSGRRSTNNMDENESMRQGQIRFGLELMRKLLVPGTNMVCSPLSGGTAMAMVMAGARSHSLAELSLLLFGARTEQAAPEPWLELLGQQLRQLNDDNKQVLNMANLLYVHHKTELKKPFVELLSKQFSTTAKQVDFERPDAAVKLINEDVAETTRQLIPCLLDKLDTTVRLVLINAIHFKGLWNHVFPKDATHEGEFRLADGQSTVKAKMMRVTKQFDYWHCQHLQAESVLLPYSNGQLAMLVLLPDPGTTVQAVAARIQPDTVPKLLQQMEPQVKLLLTMPRFRMQATHQLVDHLRSLGLATIFDQRADLSGMSDQPLFVSQMLQKVVIEVNEEGTEAAAATAAVIMLRACRQPPLPTVRLNRPFLYLLLCPQRPEQLLFAGAVFDPTKCQ